MLRTCSHVAFFSPGALHIAVGNLGRNRGADGERVSAGSSFPAEKRGGVQRKAQTVLWNPASLCLTRSEKESCGNSGRRREKCTARKSGAQRERPASKKRKRAIGRKSAYELVVAAMRSPATAVRAAATAATVEAAAPTTAVVATS